MGAAPSNRRRIVERTGGVVFIGRAPQPDHRAVTKTRGIKAGRIGAIAREDTGHLRRHSEMLFAAPVADKRKAT